MQKQVLAERWGTKSLVFPAISNRTTSKTKILKVQGDFDKIISFGRRSIFL